MNYRFFKFKKKVLISEVLNLLKISQEVFLKTNSSFDEKIFNYEITEFTSLQLLAKNKLSFFTKKNGQFSKIKNGVCLIKKEDALFLSNTVIKIPVKDPKLTFSELIESYCTTKRIAKPNYIEKNNLQICSSVKMGKNVQIGPFTSIRSNVVIGNNVKIDDRVTILDNCVIGNNSHIKSGAYLECTVLHENVTINQNTVIGKSGFGFIPMKKKSKIFFHIGGVLISKNSNIGSNCNIDRGFVDNTFVGEAVMIDNQVHIGHNCYVDDFCVVAGKCGLSGSVILEQNVMLGGEVGIRDNVTIGKNSIISAASKVFTSFPENSKIGGYPAQNLYDWQRIQVNNNKNIKMRKRNE